jgi:C-terminal processing protease CtpA/Prc
VDRKSGAALTGAQVYLEGQLSSASVVSLLSSTVTDSTGRFELRGLAAGLGSVTVSADAHHTRIVSGLQFENGQRLGPVELDLTPTADGEEPALELTGIGAVLTARNDALIISELMPGAGAAQAGLVVGDEILSIDGRSVVELGFNGAVQHIRGLEGTCVPLMIRRAADLSVVTITACRQRVRG